jgi:sugar phosphate isomerase/epimerase
VKLAVDSFSYHLHLGRHAFRPGRPRDLRWYADTCRRLGLDGLHLDPAHVDLERDVGWLAEYTRRHGLYVELGAFGTRPDELAAPLAAAERLGSRVLRTFVGGSCADGREATAARARAARDALRRSVELARRHGVCIALENHGDLFLDDLLAVLELDSPHLGVCYDSGNVAAVGEDPLAALDALIDRVVCTHLKDVCPAERCPDAAPFGPPARPIHFCALGDGDLPLGRIVETLRRAKGDAARLTVEIHSPLRRSLAETDLLAFEADNVRRSVAYARDVLGIRD